MGWPGRSGLDGVAWTGWPGRGGLDGVAWTGYSNIHNIHNVLAYGQQGPPVLHVHHSPVPNRVGHLGGLDGVAWTEWPGRGGLDGVAWTGWPGRGGLDGVAWMGWPGRGGEVGGVPTHLCRQEGSTSNNMSMMPNQVSRS